MYKAHYVQFVSRSPSFWNIIHKKEESRLVSSQKQSDESVLKGHIVAYKGCIFSKYKWTAEESNGQVPKKWHPPHFVVLKWCFDA